MPMNISPATQGFAIFETPLGPLCIAGSPRGITGRQLPEATAQGTRSRMRRRWAGAAETEPPPGVQHAIDRVLELLKGEAIDLGDIALDLEAAPDFHRKVYEVARAIPPRQTITYGEIPRALGRPHAYSAVR